MVAVALLSNPKSTGNRAQLPRIRAFCANRTDIFHYEVEHIDQIGAALASIALVRPRVIAINGGDGTVQAALTELHNGGYFPDGEVPPVAVLPNGKTNLIALDLGATGDPLSALEHVAALAEGQLAPHIVQRELIALSHGTANVPVLGMFLGGGGLADTILYCRHNLYPLGLPNGLAHVLAGVRTFCSAIPGLRRLVREQSSPVTVTLRRAGEIRGRFAVLIVTTLEKLLFNAPVGAGANTGRMKLLAVDQDIPSLMRMIKVGLFGKLGERPVEGLHFEQGDSISIAGDRSSVILDGELFETRAGQPITLTSTAPVPFLRLAA
jgi:diacylglycerol kinase family enzyme